MQPPHCASRSSTQTFLPRRAMTAAQTSELIPLPTMMASNLLMATSCSEQQLHQARGGRLLVFRRRVAAPVEQQRRRVARDQVLDAADQDHVVAAVVAMLHRTRSEERRVGKECRSRWS